MSDSDPTLTVTGDATKDMKAFLAVMDPDGDLPDLHRFFGYIIVTINDQEAEIERLRVALEFYEREWLSSCNKILPTKNLLLDMGLHARAALTPRAAAQGLAEPPSPDPASKGR